MKWNCQLREMEGGTSRNGEAPNEDLSEEGNVYVLPKFGSVNIAIVAVPFQTTASNKTTFLNVKSQHPTLFTEQYTAQLWQYFDISSFRSYYPSVSLNSHYLTFSSKNRSHCFPGYFRRSETSSPVAVVLRLLHPAISSLSWR